VLVGFVYGGAGAGRRGLVLAARDALADARDAVAGRRRSAEAGVERRRPAVGRWCWGKIRSERELVRERARCWGRTEGSGARPCGSEARGRRRGVDFG
jgi:hypothetical protein